jgi:hypothetical protein
MGPESNMLKFQHLEHLGRERREKVYDRFEFGKFRGHRISDVPSWYLSWCHEHLQQLDWRMRDAIRLELQRRSYAAEEQQPDATQLAPRVREIVRNWYRDLARQFHPDAGGSHEKMQALNIAHDELKERLQL